MKYFSSVISSSLGNILEWYDFGLFTIFSSLFSRLFFPTQDPNTALISTFGLFAVGFLCRPIGALLFGYMGDKFGRAKTLRLSILMISLPTLLIGCLPSYQQIGMSAPILLMLIRIWQGISMGGEYSGNLIYLTETAPQQYRAIFASLAGAGANIGVLFASLAGAFITNIFTDQMLQAWGWRVPYLVSGLFCIVMYLFRLQLKETSVFEYFKKQNKLVDNPIKFVFKNNFSHLLRTLGLVCMGSSFYYFCFIYLPIFLTKNLSSSYISILMSLLISSMIVLVPLAGFLCDYVGRRKMLLFNALLVSIVIIPGFYYLQFNNFIAVIFILIVFTIASALEQGTTCVAVVENFPPPARYTGLSLGYNIGNGVLGGTVPLVCAWLTSVTNLSIAPALYVSACAIITGLVVFFFTSETAGESLVKLE